MTASKKSLGSDFAKVDAYVNTAADYEELPDMSDRDLSEGVFQRSGMPARMGRPPIGDATKKQITLRLDPDIIEHFRSLGTGWQGKINEALRQKMRSRQKARSVKSRSAAPR